MASIKIVEDPDSPPSSKHSSKKDKKDKSRKKDKRSTSSAVEQTSSAGIEDGSDLEFTGEIQRWDVGDGEDGSEVGSMMSLSMDEAERERLLIEVEESSVSTVEDAPTMKSTSYYISHQRFIESSILTPLEDVCDPSTSPLAPFVIENLKKMGLQKLFPVQAEVIPFILRGVIWGGDVCVSAPTGSGKTLAYAIPIVQTLKSRVVKRLRALILVPTHDLVVQVSSVFIQLVEGTDLVVEALYGNKGFEGEQRRLVEPHRGYLAGGSSMIDIVVSTPGRLVDHLQETPGFTMQHLQFLVLDEADRLLMHSFQNWLPKVLEAIHQSREGHMHQHYDGDGDISAGRANAIHQRLSGRVDPVTNRAPFLNVAVMERQYTHLQKLLFSATLTQNPEKIDSLRLVNPQYFTATSAGKSFLYTIPSTLEQNLSVCTEQHKPLLLLHILRQFTDAQTLCFVSSIETAHRLTLLLKFLNAERFLNGNPIYEYSSSLTQQERNQIILKFKAGAPGVIICSDVMARGLDIQNVRAVVNYDLPFHVKTYVHRVGRTGRAGRAGASWSIALKDEVRRFKASLSKAENSTQNYIPLPYNEIKEHFPRYREALRQLHIQMEREKGAAATAQSLQHASFSLPLDSKNPGDSKSVLSSITTQVASAWFPEDVQTILARPSHDLPSSSATTAPASASAPAYAAHSNSESRHQPSSSTPKKQSTAATTHAKPSSSSTKRATAETSTPAKSKRRRRHKKNELDSLSLSSDSSRSDSEASSEEQHSSRKQTRAPAPSPVDLAPSKPSSSTKNRKKRKRDQLKSLSLSSTTSSSSDSEEKPAKKDKSKKDKRSKTSK